MAHEFLLEAGLDRFYTLRPESAAQPIGDRQSASASFIWLEPLLEQATRAATSGSIVRLGLDVQGIKCAACVWLMESLYKRRPGALKITINPGIGRLELLFRCGEFDVYAFVRELATFGYRTGPPHKQSDAALDDLVVRFGICAALAMNSMIFSFSMYFGLSAATEPNLFRIFSWGNWLLSIFAVLIGGSVFIKSAVFALRRGILHMDVPIALGILLTFVGSSFSFFSDGGQAAYFDTLNIFVTLMLVGRLLQRRIASHNRSILLGDDGVDGLFVRRIDSDNHVRVVSAQQLRPGQTLLVAPGELLPVRATLLSAGAAFSLEWISGEAEPRRFVQAECVPAGAHNADPQALRLRVEEEFRASALRALLATSSGEKDAEVPELRGFFHHLSRIYVLTVLSLAALAFGLWWHAGTLRALSVVVAVLVVTCPCALGLATPLGYELAQAMLRRRGLFLRSVTFFQRALRVRKVIFDKTGTLTMGEPALVTPQVLSQLPPKARAVLYQLAASSNHPKSRALFLAMQKRGMTAPLDPEFTAVEEAGRGVCVRLSDEEYRLGSAKFAAAMRKNFAESDAVVFSCNGEILARFYFEEQLHADAIAEVRALQDAGYEVQLLSGDSVSRVKQMAWRLGLPESAAHGGMSPQDKADLIRRIDAQDTLMIGDGINDAPAFSAAFLAGTPAVDRPTLPARADFYFLGRGLGPISEALCIARKTRAVILLNLGIALTYNVIVLTLSFLGMMTPLRCALAMPLSSLVVVLVTVRSLHSKRPVKEASAPKLLPVEVFS